MEPSEHFHRLRIDGDEPGELVRISGVGSIIRRGLLGISDADGLALPVPAEDQQFSPVE